MEDGNVKFLITCINKSADRSEEDESPHYTKQIEEQVTESCASCHHVGLERSEQRDDTCPDIGSEHQRTCQLLGHHAVETEKHREGEGDARCLNQHRERNTYQQQDDRMQAIEETHLRQREIHQENAENEESKSDDQFAYRTQASVVGVVERNANGNQWKEIGKEVIMNAEDRHHPCGEGGANICSHDDGYRLGKCDQSGIDRTHSSHGSGR